MIRNIKSFSFSITLSDIYETRAVFKEGTNNLIVFFKTAFGGFLLPCLIVYFVRRKEMICTLLVTFLQFIMFSLAKDKSYIFLVFAAYLIAFLFHFIDEGNKASNYILVGVCGVTAITSFGILENLLFNILIRRFFVIPSWLNYIYYDFFYDNSKIWWRQDTFFIDKFFSPVYSDSVPTIIGNIYFGSMVSNPNAGMFAEAFSRCGYLGIIIYPFLFVLLLNIIQRIYKGADKSVLVMLAFSLSISIENDVITSTAFVFVVIIILLFSFTFKSTGGYKNAQYFID